MRILFLSQRVPYPPNRGDKILTWRVIERMARKHQVTCVAFAHGDEDLRAADELQRMGFTVATVQYHDRWAKVRALPLLMTTQPLTLGVYGSRALQRRVDQLIAETDLAYAFSSSMGAFLMKHGHLPRIMHFAELDSDKWRQYAGRTALPGKLVYYREWYTLLRFERAIAHSFSENILITPLEEKIFKEQIPGASSIVMRNGVDLTHYTSTRQDVEPGLMVFVGVMNYFPNVDGCRHFVEEVLPIVRQKHPEARLAIVGSKPMPEVKALESHPGVTVTGFVDDPRDWLRKGAISVAPLRIARGIQNKVLEAMAMRLPVVGTTSATQGIEGQPGEHFVLANSPREQADAIIELLNEPQKAQALGDRGRRFVEEHYDWEVALRPLDELLDRLSASVRPSTPS